MLLVEQISADIKKSMKDRDKFRTQVLRMVLSECNYAKASIAGSDSLDDAATMKVLVSYHKRLVKSLEDYPEGDRKDTIQQEIAIVADYLPKKLDEAATAAAIQSHLAQTDDRQFGSLMKAILGDLGASADGKLVSSLLKKALKQ